MIRRKYSISRFVCQSLTFWMEINNYYR